MSQNKVAKWGKWSSFFANFGKMVYLICISWGNSLKHTSSYYIFSQKRHYRILPNSGNSSWKFTHIIHRTSRNFSSLDSELWSLDLGYLLFGAILNISMKSDVKKFCHWCTSADFALVFVDHTTFYLSEMFGDCICLICQHLCKKLIFLSEAFAL